MKAKITDTEWVELRDQAVRAVLENDDLSLFEKFINRKSHAAYGIQDDS